MPVVVFIVVCAQLAKIDLASKGEFYPLSNFPMYANPKNRPLDYYFLVDGKDEAIGVVQHTGFTAVRMKKLLWSQLMRWAEENGKPWNLKSSWLTDAVRQEAGREILRYLRKRSEDLQNPFPGQVKLMEGVIVVAENGQLSESTRVIATDG